MSTPVVSCGFVRKRTSSVEVYLHTGAKVRHDRFHIFSADAQGAGRNGSRNVGGVGGVRRQDPGAAVERDAVVSEIRNGALTARNGGGWRAGGFGGRSLGPELNGHFAKQRALAGQIHPRAVDRDVEVQPLVEFRLALRELDGDAQLVLLRLDDRVGALALGGRHVLAELRDILIVLEAFGEEPRIDGQHRDEAEPEYEDKARISAPEIAPCATPPIAFSGAIGTAASLDSALLSGFEDLHVRRALSSGWDYIY